MSKYHLLQVQVDRLDGDANVIAEVMRLIDRCEEYEAAVLELVETGEKHEKGNDSFSVLMGNQSRFKHALKKARKLLATQEAR